MAAHGGPIARNARLKREERAFAERKKQKKRKETMRKLEKEAFYRPLNAAFS